MFLDSVSSVVFGPKKHRKIANYKSADLGAPSEGHWEIPTDGLDGAGSKGPAGKGPEMLKVQVRQWNH